MLLLQFSSYVNQTSRRHCIGYHGGIQSVSFLCNRPSFKKFVALWNFNVGVNGKIVKCATSWKWLVVEWNGWKFGTCSPRKFTCTFWLRSFEFGLETFSARCKISDVKIFKRPLLPHLSSNFNQTFMEFESMVSRVEYRLLLALAIRQKFKFYCTWNFC